jgi:serine/threonine protein kinase/tetratricopeptide (TPR) repeat protein
MSMTERSIFISALELATPEERAAYLDSACGLDAAARRRIEALLHSHAQAGSFLDSPAMEAHAIAAAAVSDGPGSRIGPYKLLERLGEGGMGVVYMAEQETPVRRRVALKIIKPGMDSAQVIARFEAERQALAMMDHINIARVLDAGTTDTGRPYFMMELVNGTPITAYCDDNHLTLRERLGLFVQVCHAIQHAHQKGVIHRDVKPGNVLVTLYDGKPVPKVIDFGVAKAVEQRLTERTLFTRYGVLVGTFEYMAPEQAEMSALGVDTRSDIYSLGVLLYELLTGSTPLERERVRAAAFADVLRLIREEEPPRPSTRLSTIGRSLSAVSARRRVEPQRLTRMVRGELDWIVMKCLDKDRARRYETAHGLARDVQRHLDDQPVLASPPSALYALRKFARRNKALLATSTAVAAALLLGTALATYGFVDARKGRREAVESRDQADQQRALAQTNAQRAQREAAKAGQVNRFLREMLSAASPAVAKGADPTVRQTLDSAVQKLDDGMLAEQPEVQASVRYTIGAAYVALGQTAAAQPQLDAALNLQQATLGKDHPDVATILHTLGELAMDKRDWGAAVDNYRLALAIRRKHFGEEHELVAATSMSLANALVSAGKADEADALHEKAIAMTRKLSGERSTRTARALSIRGILLSSRGDWAGAEALHRHAEEIYRAELGDDHISVAIVVHNIALARLRQGDYDGAEPLLRKVLPIYRATYGPEHPDLLGPMNNLHRVLARKGDPEAGPLMMDILRLQAARVTNEIRALPSDPALPGERAFYFCRLGRFEEALADREREMKLDPDNVDAWFCAAIDRLYLGDVEGFRAHAGKMIERFKDRDQPDPLERAAKAWLLSPPPAADVAAVMPLIDKALAAEHGETRIAWFELSKAIAEYRAGNHASCLDWIGRFWTHSGKISFGDRRYPEGTALALAAMAHRCLGQIEEANSNLEKSIALMNEAPKPGRDDLGYGPENWVVWDLFLREAKQQVGNAPNAPTSVFQ